MNKSTIIFIIFLTIGLSFYTSVKSRNLGGNNRTLVTEVKEFEQSETYYIELFLKVEYDYQVLKSIVKPDSEVIYKDDFFKRVKISDELAHKYFMTDGSDTLILFNTDQSVVDTIYRKRFEYYEDEVESGIIATYKIKSGKNINSKIAISLTNGTISPSAKVYKDTQYIEKLIATYKFKPTYIMGSGNIQSGHNTFSYLSFGDYKIGKEGLYFFKNGVPTDSIINDFVISDIIPVPLANPEEYVYLAHCLIPETDIYWTGLFGLNYTTGKINWYERNRYIRKPKIESNTNSSSLIISTPSELKRELESFLKHEISIWTDLESPLIAKYTGNDFGDYHHITFEDSSGNSYDFGFGNNDFGDIQLFDDDLVDNPGYLNETFEIHWEWKASEFPCCSGEYELVKAYLPSIVSLKLIEK